MTEHVRNKFREDSDLIADALKKAYGVQDPPPARLDALLDALKRSERLDETTA